MTAERPWWSPAVRAAALRLLSEGETLVSITGRLGVPPSTLSRWKRQQLIRAGGIGRECLGFSPHVAPLCPDAVRLTWWADPGEPGRVIAHTCGCVPVSYELVSYRGRFRIRRTRTGREGVERVLSRDSWVRAAAEETWRRLLAGDAG
ncbi:transposase [Streptosporangium sandarakinum]|uniref:Helix-turn-helix domain-containing protein n=1 Tax=Streptosporangium pseudovulgare TaxID=35765 RepID=A0ABQ2R4P6_9ACTN|nr:helix-turn-helix domain-containing protein [Streptosporangium pseudovulgare]GGQ11224.1 hypothetical protein GCM10010140_46720 [Streptosporangium pseudovulgare]